MLNRKKLHFYQLSFVFGALIIITLLFQRELTSRIEPSEDMMTQSMGNMMSSMHLKNINLTSLFASERESKSDMNMSSSHESNNSVIKGIHYVTTITIVALLPFIIAGVIFLAIIWIK